MKIDEILEIYGLIANGSSNIAIRKQTNAIRKKALLSASTPGTIIKNAFDTRRINQETDYIPRRGLQNYHRSEKFISDEIAIKIQAFTKLNKVLLELKLEFGKQPEWQDSYTRVLASSIQKGLRTDQSDGDFSDAQPSMGSFAYLEELLYVRYRLTTDNLLSMANSDLRNCILKKDELLVSGGHQDNYIITPSDVNKYSYDHMVDKMLATMATVMTQFKPPQAEDTLTSKLFDVKATKDNPEIERTVTITIKDKIADKMEKSGVEVVTKKIAEESADEIVLDDIIGD